MPTAAARHCRRHHDAVNHADQLQRHDAVRRRSSGVDVGRSGNWKYGVRHLEFNRSAIGRLRTIGLWLPVLARARRAGGNHIGHRTPKCFSVSISALVSKGFAIIFSKASRENRRRTGNPIGPSRLLDWVPATLRAQGSREVHLRRGADTRLAMELHVPAGLLEPPCSIAGLEAPSVSAAIALMNS